jgi:hypothetical protein
LGDALGNNARLRCAGLQEEYGIFLNCHGAEIALDYHRAIEHFHALQALIQVHPELRPPLGDQPAVRCGHLKRLSEGRRKRVKCGITLAKFHVIDLAAVGSQFQLREVEQ